MDDKVLKLLTGLNTILIGKQKELNIIVSAILSGGNLLLEDSPGVGKTIISKSIAKLIKSSDDDHIKFSRIQGTPDLLPYDITGVDIYEPEKREFVFKKGPIFADILLFDELNRATPKVQSALLQAMAERLVTVGNFTYSLPDIFFVIATQNPVESEGTYPLPAAQLDRFTICLNIGYPDFHSELDILKKGKSEDRLNLLKPVIDVSEILKIRENIKSIEVNEKILQIICKVAERSRDFKDIKLGLSTRACLMMIDILKSYAYINERDYVTDQDLLDLSSFVWAHRLILTNPQVKPKDIIERLIREEIRKVLKN